MRHRSIPWLLVAASFLSVVGVEAPVEAQRASIRAQGARAAHARARRARIRRARVERARAERARRAATAEAVARPRQVLDDERPPPMDLTHVDALEEARAARRREALDPELFGPRETPQSSAPRDRARFSPLEARAAARVFYRGLSYRDVERGAVTAYELPFGTGLSLSADYYPGAHFANDAWAHLGVSWSFAHSIGVSSVGPNGVSYPTNAYAWHVGMRLRVPLDEAGGAIGLEAGGGEHGFRVERARLTDPPAEGVPSADYDLFRFALTGRFVVGSAAIGGRIAYLPVFGAGLLATNEYFGNAEVHGFEAAIALTIELGLGFELLAEIDARLFLLGFAPSETAAAAAGGAFDRMVGINAGVRWTMPDERVLRGPAPAEGAQ